MSGETVSGSSPSEEDQTSHPSSASSAPTGADARAPELDGKSKKSGSKGGRRALFLVAILIVIVAGGFWLKHWWDVGRFMETTDDAYLQADQVTMAPKVAGYVEKVLVKDHQEVKAGDPLVQIDEKDYRTQLTQADANVTSAKANLVRAETEVTSREVAVTQAEAQLDAAKVQAAFAESQVKRYAPLVKSGAQPEERLSQFTTQRDQTAAQVKVAAASVTAAKQAVEIAKAAVKQAQAAIAQAEAQRQQAQNQLDDTLIRSPIDGRIGNKTVRVGQFVQPGLRLMNVVPVQNIYLTANFKETQIELMRPGQPATIKVDALSSTPLHGHVESFSPGTGAQFALIPPENATGNFTKIVQRVPVRISVDAGPEAREVLLPGLSVEVEVDTRSARDFPHDVEEEESSSAEAQK